MVREERGLVELPSNGVEAKAAVMPLLVGRVQ